MKKCFIFLLIAVLMTFLAAFASAEHTVTNKGITFSIPEELQDMVTVRLNQPDNDTLVSVYETASVNAANTLGEDNEDAGWIFSIVTVPEKKMETLRCSDMSGMEVFAEDDDIYYVFCHPTDVTMVRATNDEMDASMPQWEKLHEWAREKVRQEILANNRELDQESFSNTLLDNYLARATYQKNIKYELRCLDYNPSVLNPLALQDDDYLEDLTEDYLYEELLDAQAPDGEYYVLAFDDNGEEVRYDFFKSADSQNIIREVRTVDNNEYETIYQSHAKDPDDDDKTTTGILKAWCDAVAHGKTDDD